MTVAGQCHRCKSLADNFTEEKKCAHSRSACCQCFLACCEWSATVSISRQCRLPNQVVCRLTWACNAAPRHPQFLIVLYGCRSCHACIEKYQTRHGKPHGIVPQSPSPESPQAADSASAAPQATESAGAAPQATNSDGTAQQATDFDGTAQQAAHFDRTAQQAADFDGDALQAAGLAGYGMGMDESCQLPLPVTPMHGPHSAWLPGRAEGETAWGTTAAAAPAASRERVCAQLCQDLGLQADAVPGASLGRPTRLLQAVVEDLKRLCGDDAFVSRAQQGLGAHAMASLGHMEGMEGILDSWASTLGGGGGEAAARSAGSYGRVYMGGSGRAGPAPPAFEWRLTVSATLTMASHAVGYHDGTHAAQPGYGWPPPREEAVDSAGGHDSAWALQLVSPW